MSGHNVPVRGFIRGKLGHPQAVTGHEAIRENATLRKDLRLIIDIARSFIPEPTVATHLEDGQRQFNARIAAAQAVLTEAERLL